MASPPFSTAGEAAFVAANSSPSGASCTTAGEAALVKAEGDFTTALVNGAFRRAGLRPLATVVDVPDVLAENAALTVAKPNSIIVDWIGGAGAGGAVAEVIAAIVTSGSAEAHVIAALVCLLATAGAFGARKK